MDARWPNPWHQRSGVSDSAEWLFLWESFPPRDNQIGHKKHKNSQRVLSIFCLFLFFVATSLTAKVLREQAQSAPSQMFGRLCFAIRGCPESAGWHSQRLIGALRSLAPIPCLLVRWKWRFVWRCGFR